MIGKEKIINMNIAQCAVIGLGIIALLFSFLILKDHENYWMTEAIIIITLPLIVTAALFIAVSQQCCDGFRQFFAVLTAVLTFIGGYAAAEGKNKAKNNNPQNPLGPKP